MAIRDRFIADYLLPTPISANTTVGAFTDLGSFINLICQLIVSGTPTGGAPTLDIYLQTSIDGGVTFYDIAHTQYTTSQTTRIISIAGDAAGSASPVTATDGTLTGETVRQGPWGDQFRLKLVFAAGASTGSYTLAAKLFFD